MVIDLHIHTSYGSDDSLIDPQEVVQRAKEAGLHAVCITEHGNKRSRLAEELSREFNFLVLAGIEASTDLGDILLFGLESYPREIYRAADLRRLVTQVGGVMIAAHPFRSPATQRLLCGGSRELENKEQSPSFLRRLLGLVDAIEVANGWSTEEEAQFCHQAVIQLGLPGTGGSDAHVPEQIGCCVTIFGNEIRNERELVAELKRGNFRAEDRRTAEQKDPCYWFPG